MMIIITMIIMKQTIMSNTTDIILPKTTIYYTLSKNPKKKIRKYNNILLKETRKLINCVIFDYKLINCNQ
jgi:hypothetical protein